MNFLARSGVVLFPLRLVIGLMAVGVGAFFIRPDPYFAQSWLFQGLSACVVVAGLLLRAWGAAYAGYHTRSDVIEAPRLVTAGPYAYVRNPIYLGSLVLGLGMVGLLGDPKLLVLYALTFCILFFAIIPAEEAFLLGQFGGEFREYCEYVPRIIPRFPAWKNAAALTPNWLSAKGDIWLAALLAVIFAGLRFVAYLKA